MSPAFDAEIERGAVVLEINRRPVTSAADYNRLTAGARTGDVLAFYLYVPDSGRDAARRPHRRAVTVRPALRRVSDTRL